MQYFIDSITTYRRVNQKGSELQAYVSQFEQRLIANECSLYALKCDIEHQIKYLNEKYPRSRPICLEPYSSGSYGQWSVYVAGNTEKVVCIIHYKKVLGYYKFSEKTDETIKRLEYSRDCIDTTYQAGMDEYNRLDTMIKELKQNEKQE